MGSYYATGTLARDGNVGGPTISVEAHRVTYTRYFYEKGDLRCEAEIKMSPLKAVGTWLPSEGRWDWVFYSDV